jgi:hypothetical protein
VLKLANRLVAVTLLALALGVSLAPRHVPGLTLPDSSTATKAMSGMSDRLKAIPNQEMVQMKLK